MEFVHRRRRRFLRRVFNPQGFANPEISVTRLFSLTADCFRSPRLNPYSFWLLPVLIVSLSACLASPVEPAPKITGDSYEVGMWNQGYVELIGDYMVAAEMPTDPSQADLGREQYRQICLACHGDWGQGLTPQWREEWEEDANCWEAKCHAPSHPEWGFELPKAIPPVLGPGSLVGFKNAEELHQHILKTMPWWNPGGLTDEQSWLITAFLMRERGELVDTVELDRGNASIYQLRTNFQPPPDPTAGVAVIMVAILLVTISMVRRRDGQTA